VRILAIGSTIKKTLFGVYRALRVDDDGHLEVATPSGVGLEMGVKARDTLPTAVAEDVVTTAIGDLYGRLRVLDAAFSQLSQGNRVSILNPDSSKASGPPLFDVINGVSIVGGTTYDYYFTPEEFGKAYLSWRLNGGSGGAGITMTIEMTAQDDGTAKESCDYDDITNDLVGAATITAAAGADNDDYLVDNGGIMGCAKWVHVKVIVAATTGTADWTLYLRQRYM
jgi:hypothetical protein